MYNINPTLNSQKTFHIPSGWAMDGLLQIRKRHCGFIMDSMKALLHLAHLLNYELEINHKFVDHKTINVVDIWRILITRV